MSRDRSGLLRKKGKKAEVHVGSCAKYSLLRDWMSQIRAKVIEDIWNLNCAARKTRHQNAAANSAHCILFNFFLPRLIYDQFMTSL